MSRTRRSPGFSAALLIALLPLAACDGESPMDPTGDPLTAAYPSPGGVDDLRVSWTGPTSATLTWTEVDDGTGNPAWYRLKYAEPAINWKTATIGCTNSIEGSRIGAEISCTVEGLEPATEYDFLLMSHRLVGKRWAAAKYSNVATGTTTSAAGGVTDLTVTATTASTATLEWTEVDDGTGNPASYRVKYGTPTIGDWNDATIGCQTSIEGNAVGEPISCTVEGLEADTGYEFQLMSFRLVDGVWVDARYSNVAAGTSSAAESDTPSGGDSASLSVDDLRVDATTEVSVTLSWTQVDDGTGNPAWYRVKYAVPPLEDWSNATIGCDQSIAGTEIGATMSCTVEGLSAGTTYDFQLMSYRTVDGVWADARYSNVATGSTAASLGSDDPGSSTGDPSLGDGIWVGRDQLRSRATSGAAWESLLTDAGRSPGVADISDQDSNHDVRTMAAALVCVRTGEHCTKARNGVLDAIGTESGARWLAVGRNLAAYVIAADLLGLRADGVSGSAGTRVEAWIEGWLTKRLSDNNSSTLRGFRPFGGSANAMAQEGLAYTAVAAYLRDDAALERAWDAFRTFACDPTAPDRENIYLDKSIADDWTIDSEPCAINRAGTTKRVPSGLPGAGSTRRLDGSLSGDMRRGGVFQWTPGYTQYAWVGLEGFVPAAVILERAGYPAFEVADRAVLRTHEYLWYLRSQTGDTRWFDGSRARELVHLVNVVYGGSFPVSGTVAGGRTVGYTQWTHPSW